MTTNIAKLDAAACRDRAQECNEALRKSLNGGHKVDSSHSLIIPAVPRSDSFKRPWDALAQDMAIFTAERTGRMDAGETMLFATQLKYVMAEWIKTELPTAVARGFGFFVDRSVPPGAKTIAMRRVDPKGQMQLVGAQANDVPLTTVQAYEDTWQTGEYAGAVKWTISELESAAFAGMPLPMETLDALAMIAEQKFEAVAASGESTKNIPGLYNDSNYTATTPTTGTWSTPATQAQVLADCQKLLYATRARVAGVESLYPNILIIPESLWRYVQLRSTYQNTTVVQDLQQEMPGLKVVPWVKGNTAGASSVARVFCGTTAKMAGRLHEPLPLTILAPQQQGLEFTAFGRMKLGGWACNHPGAFGYMDGC